MDDYQTYIAISKYARYLDDKGRRETWLETVNRYVDFWFQRYPDLGINWEDITNAIYNLEVMPSMRALTSAGQALDDHNVSGYNCAYTPIDQVKRFSEIMYILLCGTGVGYSVESRYIGNLPTIAERLYETDTTIVVRDSKLGWAKAYKELLSLLYSGHIPNWDISRIRPAGSRLRTFGGRASGPEPLVSLFQFTVQTFRRACGRKLTTLEVHDLVCKIADIVVVGGVRRSALISLSDAQDRAMRDAKRGQWWSDSPYRALANNSVCYSDKPRFQDFLEEWHSLYESRSGERGIFSRQACIEHLQRNVDRRDTEHEFGTNPCSEIILRPQQFCNLTEVVVRSGDSIDNLRRKVSIATILGTLQSTLTDFKFLSSDWRKNCEEERLLGVSLTGIMDHPILSNGNNGLIWDQFGYSDLPSVLRELKNHAIEVNREWSSKLGITPSTAITCVKPSGTVSQLCNTSSGIHPRFAPYYIRRVRNDVKDPLTKFLIDQGVPFEPDVTKPNDLVIFSFPQRAPEGAIVGDIDAVDQLNIWKIYAENWCEHKPSITVYYNDNNFLACGDWIYNNFDCVSGIAFLPESDHVYQQAPYEAIDEETYNILCAKMPKIKWEEFVEEEDVRAKVGEFACTSDRCEITYE